MSEFWLWFWRPIAEALGVIALIFGIAVLHAIVWFVGPWWRKRK